MNTLDKIDFLFKEQKKLEAEWGSHGASLSIPRELEKIKKQINDLINNFE